MKGRRFYEEFKTSKRKVPTGNVVAIDTTRKPYPLNAGGNPKFQRACISAVYFQPNSPVVGGSVSLFYLRCRCKRISEVKARKIHPKLFEYLNQEEAE